MKICSISGASAFKTGTPEINPHDDRATNSNEHAMHKNEIGHSGRPMRANVDQCRPMQTNADQCRPVQTNTDQCRPMQTNAD